MTSSGSLSHIAIIMDGNGRWAKSRFLPRTAGHKSGAESARKTIKACVKHNIRFLTLYAFSSENWNRPQDEVSELMTLLGYYLDKELRELHENQVCVKIIGDRSRLSKDILDKIENAEEITANNSRLTLQVALSYGSRQEITTICQTLATKVAKGELSPHDITQDHIEEHLFSAPLPDPDLLIRTGGEQRISNFLLWQSAYTELYFTDCLWPDFSEKDLLAAIEDYHRRERRFGCTSEQTTTSSQASNV